MPETDPNPAVQSARQHIHPTSVVVFDTETSGFDGAVLQLAFVVATRHGEELFAYSRLWRLPSGHTIDARARSVHGITYEKLDFEGIDPREDLDDFLCLCEEAHAKGCELVAHNAQFDVARLNYTARAWGVESSLTLAHVLCTMQRSAMHCGLRDRAGRKKRPRNDELYRHLFGQLPGVVLHDALNDTRVTLASFAEGHRRRWW